MGMLVDLISGNKNQINYFFDNYNYKPKLKIFCCFVLYLGSCTEGGSANVGKKLQFYDKSWLKLEENQL